MGETRLLSGTELHRVVVEEELIGAKKYLNGCSRRCCLDFRAESRNQTLRGKSIDR
jgi:hypothetical protein